MTPMLSLSGIFDPSMIERIKVAYFTPERAWVSRVRMEEQAIYDKTNKINSTPKDSDQCGLEEDPRYDNSS